MRNPLEIAVERTIEQLEVSRRTDRFFNDPNAWAEYMLGIKLWSKQREVAQSLMDNKNVAVKAGHGVGKSFLSAVMIAHWVDTRYPNCFVASTAPSTAQIGAIVWRELRKIYDMVDRRFKDGLIDHRLPGEINSDNRNNEWKSSNGQLIGFGRKPPDGKEDSAMQGIHAQYVLAIGDEAVGLSAEMIGALGNITSNEDSRRLLIANPTNPASYMGHIFKEDTGAWVLKTISVFDSPNFTAEKNEMPADALASLSGPQYVEDMKKEYGEESARYRSRVLGEFAFDMGDTLITPMDISPALDTHIVPSGETRPVLGVDVARMGTDSTVIYKYHDGQLRLVDSKSDRTTRTTETALWVHRAAVDCYADEVRIDGSGVGGGVVDEVYRLAEGRYKIVEMVGQAASPNKRQWRNARAFWWDTMRKRLREGKIDMDVNDERLQDELCSVEYFIDDKTTGGLAIESKTEMRKRGIKSPDFADAAIYACADLSEVTDGPYAGMKHGDKITVDPYEAFGNAGWDALPW